MSVNYVQSNTLYLAGAGVVPAAVNIVLTDLTDIYGNILTMASFGSKGYITLEPDTTNEEAATFTTVTANANGTYTLGGVSTMLAKSPYTETSGLVRGHSGGTKVVITDNVGFWNTFANTQNNNSFIGTNTIIDPVGSTDIANKQWVLSVVNGGAVSTNNVIVSGNAGETVAAGNLVYLKSADGFWWKADADISTTVFGVKMGIAQGSGTATNAITGGVLIYGQDTNQSGMTGGTVMYASNTAGAISSSAGTISRVIGIARTATNLYFDPYFNMATYQAYPTIRTIESIKSIRSVNGNLSVPSTTQFDITNPSGTTFRYTYDGTGTDPVLPGTVTTGMNVQIQAQNFNAANNGTYTVTGTGTNYFEVSNVAGVAENNKTVGTGYIQFNSNWTKPTGLDYIRVRLVGAGGGSGGADAAGTDEAGGSGGAGGGYSEKIIAAASLSATETVIVGVGGLGGLNTGGNGIVGTDTSFGSHLSATGGGLGSGSAGAYYLPAYGGVGSNGNINTYGEFSFAPVGPTGAATLLVSGRGGSSMFGVGGLPGSPGLSASGGNGYGSGGAGAFSENGAATAGTSGASGVVYIEEFYL